MPADKRFLERVARIERGKQWEPDGVLGRKDMERIAKRRKRKARKGQSLSMFIALAAVLIYFQPEIPEPIIGFFEAQSTEAAIASLNQMPVFARISAP